jgi:cardiolipin synthase
VSTTIVTRGRRATLIDWFATKRRKIAVITVILLVLVVAGTLIAMPERQEPPFGPLPSLAVSDTSFKETMAAHTSAAVVSGNSVELLLNGERIFPAKLALIRAARTSISYAEYFYADGEPALSIADALADRCRAGVDVKILVDGVGALAMNKDARRTMEAAGCHVVTFRPVGRLTIARNNDRNHRRILVADGRVGITGGSGVSWKWRGDGRQAEHWRDTDVRIEGPIVSQLQAAFAENWREATGEVLGGPAWFPAAAEPRGRLVAHVVKSSPQHGSYGMESLFLLAVSGARRSIQVTNPYFLPDEHLGEAIVGAARRGVRVKILVPGVIDHALVRDAGRRHFGKLLQEGVEIWEYKPALLHSKTMVVDGTWATVGSTNLDRRSFAMNDELNVAVYDPGFAAELERVFAADIARATRVTYEAWTRRPLTSRLYELISIPLAPLL